MYFVCFVLFMGFLKFLSNFIYFSDDLAVVLLQYFISIFSNNLIGINSCLCRIFIVDLLSQYFTFLYKIYEYSYIIAYKLLYSLTVRCPYGLTLVMQWILYIDMISVYYSTEILTAIWSMYNILYVYNIL